jgi:(p)ppGpp synthase/HD superfamily hydrolase
MDANAELNSIEAAVLFATAVHAGQKDKSGKPYILHPLRVMLAVAPDETMMKAAVLHDVVEDCGVRFEDLRAAGFDEDVIAMVDLLTRPPKEAENRPTHREYVQRICDSGNRGAQIIKLSDSLDNLSRVMELPPEQRSIRDRYEKTISMLYQILGIETKGKA